MPQKKIVVWLILIFVCGALIRLPHFLTVIPSAGVWQPKIIWSDEAMSIHFASQKISQTIALSGLETTPCLFVVLLHFWLLIFGSSVMIASILPFLFSLAGIIAVYFLGRRIYDEKIGLFAATLLALSPLNIQYSTEIRTYPLLVFLTILFLLFLWRVKDEGRPRDWIGVVIFSLLLLYTHYTAVILVVFGWIFLAVVKKNETKKIIFSWLAISIGIIPLLLIFRRWTDFLGIDGVSLSARFFSHGGILEFLQYLYLITFGLLGATGPVIILSLLIIGFLIYFWRREKNLNSRVLIVFIVTGWLALAGLKLIYHERYYLIFTIPMILLMAEGLHVMYKKYRTVSIVGGLIFLFIFILPCYVTQVSQVHHYFAPDFVKIISSQYQTGDVIIADHYSHLLWSQYYHGPAEIKLFFPYKDELLPADSNWRWLYNDYPNINFANISLFDNLVKDNKRFWIVIFNYKAAEVQDPQRLLPEYLDKNYSKQASWFFPVFVQNKGVQVELRLYTLKTVD